MSMHAAADRGDLITLKLLLQRKATIDEADGVGRTPLLCAVENGQLDAVKFLIEQKANVKVRADTEVLFTRHLCR